jgi:hypothetical protein
VGHSVVDVADLEGEGPGGGVRFVRWHLGCEAFDGMTMIAVGAPRGSYEPRGPF